MMIAALFLAGVLSVVPKEYEVVCGSKPIPGSPTLKFTLTARDGTVEKFTIAGGDDDPEAILALVLSMSRDGETEFMFRRGKDGTFYVGGTKKSPIQSLVIDSNGWRPLVRPVLAATAKKK